MGEGGEETETRGDYVLGAKFDVFFFQAEDGIRDLYVTGVQTCALPICCAWRLVAIRASRFARPRAARRRSAPERAPIGIRWCAAPSSAAGPASDRKSVV